MPITISDEGRFIGVKSDF